MKVTCLDAMMPSVAEIVLPWVILLLLGALVVSAVVVILVFVLRKKKQIKLEKERKHEDTAG